MDLNPSSSANLDHALLYEEKLRASNSSYNVAEPQTHDLKEWIFPIRIPITALHEDGYSFVEENKGILITLESCDGEYMGSYMDLGIWVCGNNLEDIKKKFIAELLDLFDALNERPPKTLGINSKAWKKHINQIIQKS